MNTCVPGIGAGCPGQLRGEGAEEVEKGPGKDNDIVDVQIGLDDHRRQTNAFRDGRGGAKRFQEINISKKIYCIKAASGGAAQGKSLEFIRWHEKPFIALLFFPVFFYLFVWVFFFWWYWSLNSGPSP
jgi:hypothetical protein